MHAPPTVAVDAHTGRVRRVEQVLEFSGQRQAFAASTTRWQHSTTNKPKKATKNKPQKLKISDLLKEDNDNDFDQEDLRTINRITNEDIINLDNTEILKVNDDIKIYDKKTYVRESVIMFGNNDSVFSSSSFNFLAVSK